MKVRPTFYGQRVFMVCQLIQPALQAYKQRWISISNFAN